MKFYAVILCALAIYAGWGTTTAQSKSNEAAGADNKTVAACFKSFPKTTLQDGNSIIPKNADETCGPQVGGIEHLQADLQKYTNMLLKYNFDYLLTSSHYNNYKESREGFGKYFRKLADDKWEAAKDMIKYMTMRGGHMDFSRQEDTMALARGGTGDHELCELKSLAQALDWEKYITQKAIDIHSHSETRKQAIHDPGVDHYLEENIIEKQEECVRKLSGHVTDMIELISHPSDFDLSLHFFDEYLASQ